MSDPIARFVAVISAIVEPRFPVTSGAVTLEHDGRGEAQKFGLVPEPWGSAVGTPAAGVSDCKLGQRNHVESGRPNVLVPGLGKWDSWLGLGGHRALRTLSECVSENTIT